MGAEGGCYVSGGADKEGERGKIDQGCVCSNWNSDERRSREEEGMNLEENVKGVSCPCSRCPSRVGRKGRWEGKF